MIKHLFAAVSCRIERCKNIAQVENKVFSQKNCFYFLLQNNSNNNDETINDNNNDETINDNNNDNNNDEIVDFTRKDVYVIKVYYYFLRRTLRGRTFGSFFELSVLEWSLHCARFKRF